MSKITGDFDQPLIVDDRQVLLLCQFINEVLDGLLPRKIEIKTNGPALKIQFKAFSKNWHGGGGFEGKASFNSFFSFGFFSNATVSKNTLSELRSSLISLYQLEGLDTKDA